MKDKKVCIVCKSECEQSDFVMIYKNQAEKFLGIEPSICYCKSCYEKKNDEEK